MEEKKISVFYPPDFDGQLDINVVEAKHWFGYEFTHAKRGTAWETLVAAARGILAQEQRKRST